MNINIWYHVLYHVWYHIWYFVGVISYMISWMILFMWWTRFTYDSIHDIIHIMISYIISYVLILMSYDIIQKAMISGMISYWPIPCATLILSKRYDIIYNIILQLWYHVWYRIFLTIIVLYPFLVLFFLWICLRYHIHIIQNPSLLSYTISNVGVITYLHSKLVGVLQ